MLVTAAGAGALAGTAAATHGAPHVAVTGVSVDPARPVPDQLVTLTATVQNGAGSTEVVEVTDVYVRRAGGTRDLARAANLGTLSVGSSMQIPLSVRFGRARVYDLRVHVVVETGSGETIRREHPVAVVVRRGGPQLDVELAAPVVGVERALNVTVANGQADPVRRLELVVEGPALDPGRARRIAAELAPGRERTFSVPVTVTEAGSHPVAATLRYATADGQSATVRTETNVTAEPLREDVALAATVRDREAATPRLAVEVSNAGNAPLRDVSLLVTAGDRTVARRLLAPLPARTARTVAVNVTGVSRANLTVAATYETGGRAGEASTTARYDANPGRVELTGIDAERAGDVVRLSGSASNVGLAEVNSVVVAVREAANVTPAAPNREYFVGTVPPSDFVSFDLTARVTGEADAIPVAVTYLSGGERRTDTVAVPVAPGPDDGAERDRGGGVLFAVVVAGALLAAAAVAGALWWRRDRGGD